MVLKWLQDKQTVSLAYVKKSYEHDRHDKFQHMRDRLFSCSVVDVFADLNQINGVIKNLDVIDSEVRSKYHTRFAELITALLHCYCELATKDVHLFAANSETIPLVNATSD